MNYNDLERIRFAQFAWHQYFTVLIKRCFELRVATANMSEDLFIKVTL